MLEEGRLHLEFMESLYRSELKAGRFFIREHSATALSWDERCITEIIAHQDAHLVRADQWQFGLVTPGPDGVDMPALKSTKFLTNSKVTSELSRRTCDRTHVHQHLTGGRCGNAAFYPLPLVRTMLRGISKQKEVSKAVTSLVAMVPVDHLKNIAKSDNVTSPSTVAPSSKVPKVNGGHVEIHFDSRNFKDVYRDKYTNEILPSDLVRAAICEELAYFNDKVWEITDSETAESYPEANIVRCRWVLCNKGDATEPDVRARLVACESTTAERRMTTSMQALLHLKLRSCSSPNTPLLPWSMANPCAWALSTRRRRISTGSQSGICS